jgi:hypothetical protein
MVIGSQIPADRMVSAHFDAIKYGLQNDIVTPTVILFYGDEAKANLITARNGGKVLAIKPAVRRRGR